MLPTLWQFYWVDPCYFRDENATCHFARATMALYDENWLKRLDLRAKRPNLNPMEMLLGRVGASSEGLPPLKDIGDGTVGSSSPSRVETNNVCRRIKTS